ncbi:hypothetical protein VV01_00340 [Luteipulveratus halotolerans]|uniref:Uncharacterized protein n=2 Tax=Luteipulveratus halotolerans TaxID=1631356 RepID=A0A0L6CPK4_9MICO|nr:hypothetical protein VV01_00085 [Luteipulveratus halotolerans]KNX39715.1 hypothetical protein VV01_00340 [Luteipulveratus halotolerans]
MRAVVTWSDYPGLEPEMLYARWGSPMYKLAPLARFLNECIVFGQRPDVHLYRLWAGAHPTEDTITEPFHPAEGEGLPSDLNWLWTIETQDHSSGWRVRIRVEPRGVGARCLAPEDLSVTEDNLLPLIDRAHEWLRHIADGEAFEAQRVIARNQADDLEQLADYHRRARIHAVV